MALKFNQEQFIEGVFKYMKTNDVTIRDFCKQADCSTATLYRARQGEDVAPLNISTIRKLEEVMGTNTFKFNQERFMASVAHFMRVNKITARQFCEMVSCSTATLYRAMKGEKDYPMDVSTIRRFEQFMNDYLQI